MTETETNTETIDIMTVHKKAREFSKEHYDLESALNEVAQENARIEGLVLALKEWNKEYRKGSPIVTDADYDTAWLELKELDPTNPFLFTVETEVLSGKTITHAEPMLSTDKAYTQADMEAWAKMIVKYTDTDPAKITIKATSKLDGIAVDYIRPKTLITRGDGIVGNDISHLSQYAMMTTGGVTKGVGELVVDKEYFKNNLSVEYKGGRSFVSGTLDTNDFNPLALTALKEGAVHLVLFNTLPSLTCTLKEFPKKWAEFEEDLKEIDLYDTDGVVFEVVNPDIKRIMGSNNSFHRWQIAKKEIKSTAKTDIVDVVWQVGRTGPITPVCNILPIYLSNSIITNATAHNVDYYKRNGLGVGATVMITRSGEVIPKIIDVVKPVSKGYIPSECPSCNTKLEYRGKEIVCTNIACSGRIKARLTHFFSTLKILGFGPVTVEAIIEAGYGDLYTFLRTPFDKLSATLIEKGLGKKDVQNLRDELFKFYDSSVEDYKVLTALGIPTCGLSTAKAILNEYYLEVLPKLKENGMKAIYGIGKETQDNLIEYFADAEDEIGILLAWLNNIKHTKDMVIDASSPLNGKRVCFTGTCSHPRDELVLQLEQLGAKKASSISSTTNFLVCGKKPTASKVEKAKKLGITILTEEELFSYE